MPDKFEFIRKQCTKNPELSDLYIQGPAGWDMMVFCASRNKWENERRIKKRIKKAIKEKK